MKDFVAEAEILRIESAQLLRRATDAERELAEVRARMPVTADSLPLPDAVAELRRRAELGERAMAQGLAISEVLREAGLSAVPIIEGVRQVVTLLELSRQELREDWSALHFDWATMPEDTRRAAVVVVRDGLDTLLKQYELVLRRRRG